MPDTTNSAAPLHGDAAANIKNPTDIIPHAADASAADLSGLHRHTLETGSGIHPRVIEARGYYSATEAEHLQALGWSKKAARHLVPALVVPLHTVDGGDPVYQIRPDNPGTTAEGKPSPKYVGLPGQGPVVDCNPIALPELLNPDKEFWITEGCKKADALISAGICCISLSGVWNWRDKNGTLPDWEKIPLKGRQVVIAFDSDTWSKFQVYNALKRLRNFLTGRGASVSVCVLPAGPKDETGAEQKVGLDDFLAGGGTAQQLRALVQSDLPKLPRPGIETNCRQLPEITAEALEALSAANQPEPTLFVRSGRLARIRIDEAGRAGIESVDADALRGMLARCADWYSTSDKRGQVAVSPPQTVVSDILALPEYADFPPLECVTSAPTFADNGTLHREAGYSPASRCYYHPGSTPLDFPAISETPTTQQVHAAVETLFGLIGDFPFASPADRANALAYTMLPFIRPMMHGPTPLHIFDAPTAGTGKTLLAQTLACLFDLGVTLTTAPRDTDEWAKRIVALLDLGRPHVLIDNVTSLQSDDLFAALTSTTYQGRRLGMSQMLTLPVRCCWAATSNNLLATDELARRAVWVRLDARMERPEDRSEFRHPDINHYVREHRADLIAALLTLVQYWISAGRPDWSGNPPGSFEQWGRIIGGILETAGIQGFLENRITMRERVDTGREAMAAFVLAWHEKYGEDAVPSGELFPLGEILLADKLGDGQDQSRKIRLGKLLHSQKGRVYHDLVVARAGEVRSGPAKGSPTWRLEPLSPHQSGGEWGESGGVSHPTRKSILDISNVCTDTHAYRVATLPPLPPLPPASKDALILSATPSTVMSARAAASGRCGSHDGNRSTGEDRGSREANAEGDHFGCLAELLCYQWAERHDIHHEAAALLAERGDANPDIRIGTTGYDIKSVLPGRSRVCINGPKHERLIGRCSGYIICIFQDQTTANVAFVSYETASHWPRETVRGREKQPFLSGQLTGLKPLTETELLAILCPQPPSEPLKAQASGWVIPGQKGRPDDKS